jgi:PTS system nitrogen regulatory IIA component
MKDTNLPLPIDTILPDLKVAAARPVWQALAAQAAADTQVPENYLFSRLMEQESRATSGIGNGVAIAHLRLRRLNRPYTLFARAPRMVDINAIDGQPTDLFFLMLSPTFDVAGHLRRLSRLSRLMRDENLRAQLRGMDSADGLAAMLIASGDITLAA